MIKAGYLITVSTWENDGDIPITETFSGYDKATMQYVCHFLNIFGSHNRNLAWLGNVDIYGDEANKRIVEHHRVFTDKHGNNPPIPDPENLEAFLAYFHCNFHSIFVGNWHDEYYYELSRVVDKYKVEYTPHDIHLEDVTSQFQE